MQISLILYLFNFKISIWFLLTWISHIFLDYICIFPANVLAPFGKLIKPEGFGIFYPDKFIKSENEILWEKRVKKLKIEAISENYFTIILILFIILILLFY